jgi:hypothetical protein
MNESGELFDRMLKKGKTAKLGEKSFPVPLCPPQIPRELAWD